MKLNIIAATFGLVVSGLTFADSLSSTGSYQAEVYAKASRLDLDHDHVNNFTLGGTYYFDAVKTSGLPLAESAYLGKNSFVNATAADFRGPGKGVDGHFYSASVGFFIPESFLYVGAGVSRVTSDIQRDNDWTAVIGITPIDGLLISTFYNGDNGYDANINAKYVTQLGGHYVNLEARAADSNDINDSVVSIGGDFYFDNSFSVGGEISDSGDDDSFSLRTRKFFTESFSGDLTYWDADSDRGLVAGVAYRF